jgi:peptidoglycan/LPS O-acetylase OafA/YrhL
MPTAHPASLPAKGTSKATAVLPEASGPRTRNPAIDLLRAASILYIVGFWHLLGYAPAIDGYKNVVTYRLTVLVLGLFVLISGHLIGRAGIHDGADILRFYRRRLIRIYPPYLFAIVLFRLSDLIQPDQWLGAALLISSFGQDPPRTLWYISMIVVFYLLAPFLLLLHHRLQQLPSRWRPSRLVMAGGLILLTFVLGKIFHQVDVRLFLYFPAFVVGLFLRPPDLDHPLRLQTLLAVLLALVASVVVSLPTERIDENLVGIPLTTFGPLLIFLVVTSWARKLRPWPPVMLVSTASYFMYLFHRPIFWLLTSRPLPESASGQLAFLLLVCLPLIVLVSWLAQKLYDRGVAALTSEGTTSSAA